MAYEDFRTYDETDEGTNVTVAENKISWTGLTGAETSHVSDSKGAAYFNSDFTHQFECQFLSIGAGNWVGFWMLANAQADQKTLIDAGADFVTFFQYNTDLYFRVYENGGIGEGQIYDAADSTTYYVTITYDRDGGTNSTGQYVAVIRTGSHAGPTVATLTLNCSVGEQNDFEFIYGLSSYDRADAARSSDGFTQNLDLDVVAGAAGAMTTNTGYWGPTI